MKEKDPVFARTSVRAFTDEPVTKEEATLLLRAAMAAPSAMDQQPWEFWVVEGRDNLEKLASASPYAKPTARAALAIVPCVKTEGLPCPDMAEQDMGASIENLLIEAAELGLGAVWQGIYPVKERIEATAQALGIPEDAGSAPFAIVAVGHPLKDVSPTGPGRFDPARIHRLG
ncbi:MAG: nitroreductase family protein [Atopobiaceae bacterium]